MMLFMCLMIVLCTGAHGETVTPERSAVLFKEKGTVELSGRSYHVVLDISIDHLLQEVSPIRDALAAVSKRLTLNFGIIDNSKPRRTNKHHIMEFNTNDNISDTNPFLSLSNTLSDSMRAHIVFLVQELKTKHMDMEDFLISIKQSKIEPVPESVSRKSRGLIDAGGSLLNWLLGLATDSELADTNEILDRLATLSKATRKEVNLHATIINSTYTGYINIQKMVTRIKSCV